MINATAPIMGGMICPPVEAADSMAAATWGRYPIFFIIGIVKTPVEETLAMALPDMDPKKALPTTAALAGPPTDLLVTAKARFIKKSPAPVVSKKAPRRMNGTTYRVMNFVVLAGALVFILRKPISQALSSRIKDIQEQLDSLETRRAEAEKRLAQYNEQLSQLESEAAKIVDAYIKQGNEAKAKILKEAEQTAEKLRVQARRNIEHEFDKAKQKLQQEIVESSLQMAEESLKKEITNKDQDKLIDEYINKVVA